MNTHLHIGTQDSPAQDSAGNSSGSREILRVRHDTKLRSLTVQSLQVVTPRMLRVTLGGDELRGFVSLGFDDHIKLIVPPPGAALVLPTLGGPEPAVATSEPKPELRDYTPRRYDAGTNTLQIDFATHGAQQDAGPATAWALHVQVGQQLGVGGPRGSAIIPVDFDWHLLIGDDTALPAIGRRLEELPSSTRAVVIAEVEDAAEQQVFTSQAPLQVIWVHRRGAAANNPDRLLKALRSLTFPAGDYFAWAAGEATVSRAIRKYLIEERKAPKAWVKAAGYWRDGSVGTHEVIQD